MSYTLPISQNYILNIVRSTCIKSGTGNTTYLFNNGRFYFVLDGLSCILIYLIL